jgi:hypothetical protein
MPDFRLSGAVRITVGSGVSSFNASPAYTNATITFTGPSTGTVGVAANFTASLPSAVPGLVITTSDGLAGGTFSAVTQTNATTYTFTYTPANAGAKSISISSSPALVVNPASIAFTANAATPGTNQSFILTGPRTGVRQVATTFTVTPGAPLSGPGTVTIAAPNMVTGLLGAIVSPSTLSFAAGATAAQSFTVTPQETFGTVVLTMSNTLGLPNINSPVDYSANIEPLPAILNAVTWNKYAMALQSTDPTKSPWGRSGQKHMRWALRTGHQNSDNCWYELGGDYTGYAGGSQLLWRVTPTLPMTFQTLNQDQFSSPPNTLPGLQDEMPWIYDSTRDRFLVYPNPRWANIDQHFHLMLYYPATNTWEDKGAGVGNVPQYDINGHQYPITDAGITKVGWYDPVTDKFIIPWSDLTLIRLDAETLAMEWPNERYSFLQIPANAKYANFWWNAPCATFDRTRRRIVAPMYPHELNTNHGKFAWFDIDKRTFGFVPSSNRMFSTSNPIYPQFTRMVHDPRSDQYVIFGSLKILSQIYYNWELGNTITALPASGGEFVELVPTGLRPTPQLDQVIEYDPNIETVFVMPGTDSPAPDYSLPDMYTLTNIRPAWRNAMAANTWVEVPATNTFDSINPKFDPAINPTYGVNANHPAPWDSSAGGGFHSIFTSWSSSAYDDQRHMMYVYCAGGHDDYGGNERLQVNLGADAPVHSFTGGQGGWPTGAIGNLVPGNSLLNDGLQSTGTYIDGRPRSGHTYDSVQFVPGYGVVLVMVGAPYRGGGASIMKAFRIDTTTGATTFLTQWQAWYESGPVSICTAYDGTRHCIWILPQNVTGLRKLDLATGTVSGPFGIQDNHCTGNPMLFYMQEDDSLIVYSRAGGGYTAGVQGMAHCKLSNYAWTTLTYTGSFPAGLDPIARQEGEGQVSHTWDHRRRRFVLWDYGLSDRRQLGTLTPGATLTAPWTAGSLTMGGATPPVPGPRGMFRRLSYSASLDGVFVLATTASKPYFCAFS